MSVKQRIVRVLIEEIIIDLDPPGGDIVLVVHWRGGRHSEVRVRKPASGEHRRHASANAVDLIRSMAGRFPDDEIAATLNRLGEKTGQGNTWNKKRVEAVRKTSDIPAYDSRRKDGEWLTQVEAADKLGVSRHGMRRLMDAGIVAARQVVRCAPFQIRATDLEVPDVQAAARQLAAGPCRDIPNVKDQLSLGLSTGDSE